jgi:hypothetical protein
VTAESALSQLHRKARRLADAVLEDDEQVITVLPGRSRQAMVVTDQRLLLLKPGLMSGVWLGKKASSFPLGAITAINVHTGRGVVALEIVVTGVTVAAKPDLASAFQQRCHRRPRAGGIARRRRRYRQPYSWQVSPPMSPGPVTTSPGVIARGGSGCGLSASALAGAIVVTQAAATASVASRVLAVPFKREPIIRVLPP